MNSIHDSNNNSNNNVDDLTNLGDSSLCHIFRYRLRRCQFQNTFIPVNNVLSTTTTNRLCKCIVLAGYGHSSNVVYLITGNKSKVQYLGKTSQNLNKRFNWHSYLFQEPYIMFLL